MRTRFEARPPRESGRIEDARSEEVPRSEPQRQSCGIGEGMRPRMRPGKPGAACGRHLSGERRHLGFGKENGFSRIRARRTSATTNEGGANIASFEVEVATEMPEARPIDKWIAKARADNAPHEIGEPAEAVKAS